MDYTKDDEVKKVILDAARRVFQKWGMNKTTMEDIAREAGKGKSTLYYYYKSKDEIFDTVVTYEFNQILDAAKESIAKYNSAKEKLRNYIVVSLTEMKNHIMVYSIVKGELKGNREFVDRLNKQFGSRETDIVIDILTLGVELNEFSFVDEKELVNAAIVIVGLLTSMELYLFLDNEDIEKIDIAAKLIANGI